MASQRIAESPFPGLPSNGGKFLSPHLRCGLTVYPLLDKHPFAFRRGAGLRKMGWTPDAEGSLISLSWDKHMGQAAGRWSVDIKPKALGIDFAGLDVLDGDWVDVAVLRNGIQIPVCRGVVDTVRTKISVVNGATAPVVTITGRDHGAFAEFPVTWNSLWAKSLSTFVTGFMTQRLNWLPGGNPALVFQALVNGYLSGANTGAGQWELPKSLTDVLGAARRIDLTEVLGEAAFAEALGDNPISNLSQALKVLTFNYARGQKGLRGALLNESLWTSGDQTLHQTLSSWVNPLLNEWWYDLLMPPSFTPPNGLQAFLSPQLAVFQSRVGEAQVVTTQREKFGTMAAIIRERPFMTRAAGADSMWSSLPTWRIPTWMILDSDLGIGGDERHNLFELLVDIGISPQGEQAAQGAPRWLSEDIRLRGLRPYTVSTPYIAGGEQGAWQTERDEWLSVLQDWWGPSPYLRQGTITLKTLLPEIRIGQRVILDPGDLEQAEQFYVEGVNLSYSGPAQSSGASGTTTLILSRGYRGDDASLLKATTELSNRYTAVF